jgi:hypothetical protein
MMPSASFFVGELFGAQAATPTQSLPSFVNKPLCDILVESSESKGGSCGKFNAFDSFSATCGVNVAKTGALSGCL